VFKLQRRRAIVAAFVFCVLQSSALAVPSGDSGFGTYVTNEHRNQIYERVGYLAPNVTGLNSPWVNCPPDFRQWLPWVAYGGTPGGYIWYGCANSYGELIDVGADTMRNLMLGDLEREQASHDGNVGLELYLSGSVLVGRAYQTAFPVEEDLGVSDEGDPATCHEPDADGSEASESSESFGNPVHPGAGNKIQIESDYRCEGPARLAFHRYYNSASRIAGAWGSNWSADYFQRIKVLPTAGAAVYVGRPSGRYYRFRYNGTGWSAVSSSVTERLEDVLSGGARIGWIFHTRSDAAERYDAAGRLLSITYRDG
jgi:hypothetical protein